MWIAQKSSDLFGDSHETKLRLPSQAPIVKQLNQDNKLSTQEAMINNRIRTGSELPDDHHSLSCSFGSFSFSLF